jgi:hypothetical protein
MPAGRAVVIRPRPYDFARLARSQAPPHNVAVMRDARTYAVRPGRNGRERTEASLWA